MTGSKGGEPIDLLAEVKDGSYDRAPGPVVAAGSGLHDDALPEVVDDELEIVVTGIREIPRPVYGLMQQFGVSSEIDPNEKYDVDVIPPALKELYRKYGKRLKEYDDWAWDMSQKGLPTRSKSSFPFFVPGDKAEYGYLVWEKNDGKSILIQELNPDPDDPNYGIKMPDNFDRRTGKFDERPGYKLVLVMHTHPWDVTFASPFSRGVVRGPSVGSPGKSGDFSVAYRNPTAVFMIIGAVPLKNPQQRWYYGQPVHPKK
jgi:hypothetical protein